MRKDKKHTIQNDLIKLNSRKQRGTGKNAVGDSEKPVLCKSKSSIRSKNTKMALSLALVKLLEEKTIDQITVKELTEIAGVNRSTFYLHFKDVDHLFECTERNFVEGYEDILKENITENMNMMSFMNMITQLLKYVQKNSELYEVILQSSRREKFIDAIIECGKITIPIVDKNMSTQDKEYLINYMVYACMGVLRKWIKEGMKKSPEDLTVVLVKLIFTDHTSLRSREKQVL